MKLDCLFLICSRWTDRQNCGHSLAPALSHLPPTNGTSLYSLSQSIAALWLLFIISYLAKGRRLRWAGWPGQLRTNMVYLPVWRLSCILLLTRSDAEQLCWCAQRHFRCAKLHHVLLSILLCAFLFFYDDLMQCSLAQMQHAEKVTGWPLWYPNMYAPVLKY